MVQSAYLQMDDSFKIDSSLNNCNEYYTNLKTGLFTHLVFV